VTCPWSFYISAVTGPDVEQAFGLPSYFCHCKYRQLRVEITDTGEQA
jgi:hypothetical protein